MGIKYLDQEQKSKEPKETKEVSGKITYTNEKPKQNIGLLTKLYRGAITPLITSDTYNTPQANISMDIIKSLGNPLVQKISTLPSDVSNKIRADMLSQMTTPLDLALTFGGAKFGKFDNRLLQAEKAQVALTTARTALGKAVEVGIRPVAQLPTKLDIISLGKKSSKIMNAIKDPIYDVKFTQAVQPGMILDTAGNLVNTGKPGGEFVKTLGNLNRAKEAIGELISSPKIWEEAPKKELRYAKRVYGIVAKEMKNLAESAGKPIDKVLDSYEVFMRKYPLVRNSIQDAAGHAMGNKLKAAFKFGAEPAVKQAWKEVSKTSPQLKKVMGSMSRRELLKNLLTVGTAGEIVRRGSRAGGAITSALTHTP